MRVECLALPQIDDALWASLVGLRNSDNKYDNPMFEPEFIRILAGLRSDIRVLIGFESDVPVIYFPIQKHPGNWARPAAGPFSDWHSPIGEAIPFSEFLKQAGVAGMTVHGLMPSSFISSVDGLSRESSHVTHIAGEFSDFYENQQKMFPKHFKKMRRLKRNLETKIGPVEFCYDDRSDEVFEWLIQIKRDQYVRTHRHDVLGADWAQAFVGQVRELRNPRFRAVMSTLRANGILIAAELNMQSDRVLHGWLTGFDRAYATHSPGLILVERMLEEMVSQGVRIYDAGPGLSHYKKYYSNVSYPIEMGVVMGRQSRHPVRLMGTAWRQMEALPIGAISRTMRKTRRRMDQVLQAELSFSARLLGLLRAIRAFGD